MASKFLCKHKFLERLLNDFSKIYVNIKHEKTTKWLLKIITLVRYFKSHLKSKNM